MKVLSLGWGVQSFTLAAMVALGELEPIDYAIHADTTHESSLTYDFARRWTPWLEEHGVKVVTIENPDVRVVTNGRGGFNIPAYTFTPKGNGQTHRQCTGAWKIAPMRRWLQLIRNEELIEQWIGISLDEFRRMKDSNVKYISNRWPLVEKNMTRLGCQRWLENHDLEIPKRSACVFCPYHSTREWHDIKVSDNGDWEKAIEVDQQIRKVFPPYDLFIHPSRKPLDEIDFRTAEEKGQLSLWDDECSGICGV